ncbi:MAG: NAD(P)/FAD-dependent oxidoreductase [Lachnospiraceae bacterium]|nr:NAD(P)/FAD-dependent oxidoreductase [Lachnospiraceae bacterium]
MYDLAIIGGGPAGYSAALEAAGRNMRVVLFEYRQLGGTCLNRGCVPTKYLSHVGKKYYEASRADSDGISCSSVNIDFLKTADRMQKIVTELREQLESFLLYGNVEIISGEAKITGDRKVVCEGKTYEAQNLLIATGSAPSEPLLPGAITSDELLKLNKIPEKLHVLGGGVVAVEFAQIFRMLGSEVTLSIRANRILRKWDEEIAEAMTRSMKERGIRIQTNCDFKDLSIGDGSVVLSAAGRKAVLPPTENIVFDLGAGGGILVDSCGRTSVRGIYAAGDVVEGSPQLAHVGMEQGRRAVRHMAGLALSQEAAVVQCIYAAQEAVSVGLTEEEAKAKGLSVVAVKQSMAANARAMIVKQTDGFTKIVAEKESGRIVGAQLMSERAGDMATELALAIDRKMTVSELLCSVRPHPSFCEAITDVLRAMENQLEIREPKKDSQESQEAKSGRKGGLLRFLK